ncbi:MULTISPECIES: phage holin family protein [unclassified Nocardioides]|uniref:phage holin family protein n=1 Tax=unclassified Nocardioides TaxID=2615069 RepID=UPI001E60E1EC|nr:MULTISPECIES: phage holin family protein [unclassified Nocardioides]
MSGPVQPSVPPPEHPPEFADPLSGATPLVDAAPRGERSLGDIVSDVTSDISTLVKQELELAKTELKQEMTQAGKGVGLLGGAGVAGHLLLIWVSVTLTAVLDSWMPLWAAALIVTVLWAAIAAALAVTGRKALQQSNPQLPATQRTLKEDAQWATAQKS